ncbi:MAG: hypothetical protein LBS88_08635 [Tannerellaceae bacterium]|jgi:hypothetical protein|nr:hypothetical protein [Tannerellaceae bacterium]
MKRKKSFSIWQGKEVVFPDSIVFTRYATDTVDYQIKESEYKIVVYVDSTGCTSCKLRLLQWKEFITYIDSLTNEEVPFLFFFYPKDYEEMHYLLDIDSFYYPICIDVNDNLNRLNQFPADVSFQTFLLDKNNTVVLVGNPILHPRIKGLYIQQITEGQARKEQKKRKEAESTNPLK